jgi:hypothetical protein
MLFLFVYVNTSVELDAFENCLCEYFDERCIALICNQFTSLYKEALQGKFYELIQSRCNLSLEIICYYQFVLNDFHDSCISADWQYNQQ